VRYFINGDGFASRSSARKQSHKGEEQNQARWNKSSPREFTHASILSRGQAETPLGVVTANAEMSLASPLFMTNEVSGS
jgi:hypothetical protein